MQMIINFNALTIIDIITNASLYDWATNVEISNETKRKGLHRPPIKLTLERMEVL